VPICGAKELVSEAVVAFTSLVASGVRGVVASGTDASGQSMASPAFTLASARIGPGFGHCGVRGGGITGWTGFMVGGTDTAVVVVTASVVDVVGSVELLLVVVGAGETGPIGRIGWQCQRQGKMAWAEVVESIGQNRELGPLPVAALAVPFAVMPNVRTTARVVTAATASRRRALRLDVVFMANPKQN
jgi:hypothetical protein